jgi:hypothetical protein
MRLAAAAPQRAGQEVHGRRADEAGDELVGRMVVQVQRAAGLLDAAVAHHHDLVAHGHGLDLVVRDVDGGGLQALVQLLDLAAHRDAQLGVEVRQRLVEQEHLRIAHDRAAHGHALALAARELARIALQQRLQRQDLGRALHLAVDGRLVHLGEREREGHVVAHRHVRIQRVVLEHHRDVPLLGRQVVHAALADADLAAVNLFQPRDHAQQGRLAAARRAHQHRERTIGNVDVHTVKDGDLAETLLDRLNRDTGHARSPDNRGKGGDAETSASQPAQYRHCILEPVSGQTGRRKYRLICMMT